MRRCVLVLLRSRLLLPLLVLVWLGATLVFLQSNSVRDIEPLTRSAGLSTAAGNQPVQMTSGTRQEALQPTESTRPPPALAVSESPLVIVRRSGPPGAPGQRTRATRPPRPTRPTPAPKTPYVPKHRIVHFDLKGGAPKLEYFLELLRQIAAAGATGVLIEWEDTFPYIGELSSAVAGYAYTRQQLERILQECQRLKLNVIPLIQLFGHLEWVLKLDKFMHLRDVPEFSTVICAAREDAWRLLHDMITQVIKAHQQFGISQFHIGCDEVFKVGACSQVKQKIDELRGGEEAYMMWHIQRLAAAVHNITNGEVRVLAWHDMIAGVRNVSLYDRYKLSDFIEPVVWSYEERLHIAPKVWDVLKPFAHTWTASAYKGADGPNRFWPNPRHYLKNQESWIDLMRSQTQLGTQFEGIILTGWSRFDHFAVLAELLPVATPSLLLSLITLSKGNPLAPNSQVNETASIIGCVLEASGQVARGERSRCNASAVPIWEAASQHHNIHSSLEQMFKQEDGRHFQSRGWLGRMNQRLNFSSVWYVNDIQRTLTGNLNSLRAIYRTYDVELRRLLHEPDVIEFLYENIVPDLELSRQLLASVDAIVKAGSFPVRPLPGINQKLLEGVQSLVA